MAEMASNRATQPVTGIANTALTRGLRVILNAAGTLDVAAATVRGDYVTGQDIEAGKPGVVYPVDIGKVAAQIAGSAVAVGDPIYAAAAGQFSGTSTNAAYMGRCVLASAGSGVLGEVELSAVQ